MNRFMSAILFATLASVATAQKKPIKKPLIKPPVNEYAMVDKLALQLPDSLATTTGNIAGYINTHFTKELEKARAVFVWLAANIRYDRENMYAINFYESKEDKIKKPLATRKGVCENYALLFNEICSKCGIKSYEIIGYTRQNGRMDNIPHAWCAANIDGQWDLYDPTWASGNINAIGEKDFTNDPYFKVTPAVLIASHMPFDYLWQFLDYPANRKAFSTDTAKPDSTRPYFNFADSLQAYEKQDSMEQLNASISRIERNGAMNSMVYDVLQHLKQNMEVDGYNKALLDYNRAVNLYNVFIDYRYHRFKPSKPDAEIQEMIDAAKQSLTLSKTKLNRIQNPGTHTASSIAELNKSMTLLEKQINEQLEWLKKYFSPGKLFRSLRFN